MAYRSLTIAVSLLVLAGTAPGQNPGWDALILEGSRAIASHHYSQAEDSFLAALRQVQDVPESDDRVAATLHQLSAVYLLENRLAEAQNRCVRALQLRQKYLGDVVATAHTLVVLGTIYLAAGHPLEAEKWTRGAISIYERQSALPRGETGAAWHGLARSLFAQGKYHQAEMACHRALDEWGANDADSRVNRANVIITLAHISQSRHQDGQSAEYHARALSLLEEVYQPSDPNLAPFLSSAAFAMTVTKRYAEAERLGRRALALASDPDSANAALAVGMALAGQSRFTEAEPFYRRAMMLYESSPASPAAQYAAALRAFAQFLRRTRRPSEAKTLEARAQSEAASRQTVDVSEFRSHR